MSATGFGRRFPKTVGLYQRDSLAFTFIEVDYTQARAILSYPGARADLTRVPDGIKTELMGPHFGKVTFSS